MREINRKELKDKLNKDDVTLIEVLEPAEYEKGHIKHAINIPLETIVTEAREKFPFDEEIVVYCSDYDCTASPAAAKKLEDTGFKNIYHYPGGKKDWREAGLPIER